MFGNNDDQNQQENQTQSAVPGAPEPVADGSLGSPVLSSPDLTTVSPTTAPQTPTNWADTASSAPTTTLPTPSGPVDNDLLDIKQQALQQLTPLVGQLNQTPEEKFRTTMMMIQASDDQMLLKDAFESAKQITDDKARAQALLDVINEINYFTQQHKA